MNKKGKNEEISTTKGLDPEYGSLHQPLGLKLLSREIARVIISEESIDEFVSHGLTESLEGHPSLKGRPTSETWIYGKLSDKVDKILNDENFISKLEKGLLKESIQVYKDQFSDEKEWFKDLIENKLDEVFESFKDSLKNLL